MAEARGGQMRGKTNKSVVYLSVMSALNNIKQQGEKGWVCGLKVWTFFRGLTVPTTPDADYAFSVRAQARPHASVCDKTAGVRLRSPSFPAEATKHCNSDSASLCLGLGFPPVTAHLCVWASVSPVTAHLCVWASVVPVCPKAGGDCWPCGPSYL